MNTAPLHLRLQTGSLPPGSFKAKSEFENRILRNKLAFPRLRAKKMHPSFNPLLCFCFLRLCLCLQGWRKWTSFLKVAFLSFYGIVDTVNVEFTSFVRLLSSIPKQNTHPKRRFDHALSPQPTHGSPISPNFRFAFS